MDVAVRRRAIPALRAPTLEAIRPLARRLAPFGVLAAVAVWLMRAALFTTAIPAGTDMFGFVTRAQENSLGGTWSSVWAPSVFGSPRIFTLDNVLGLLTKATGDPLVTVKVLSVVTLFASGALAMLLVDRWFHVRTAAVFAGALYMTSQASLSRWASGQLNVEIATALAPLLILLWSRCHDAFSPRRAVGFGLALSALMLVRLDMVLYVVPFLAIYTLVRLTSEHDRGTVARAVGGNVAVLLPTLLALDAYQLLPMLAGVRPAWVSASELFTLADIENHSLGLFHSALGFGREIGYLGFTGQQTWYSHPYVGSSIYYGTAAILVVLAATTAVQRRRDVNVRFLAIAAIVATFVGKGARPPLGAPYRWAVSTIPLFGNLRNPNRWLIFQAIAYAALGGIALAGLLHAVGRRYRVWRITVRWTAPRFCILLLLVFLPVAPTLFSGFQTWRPQPAQVALMRSVGGDGTTSIVATIPFDQSIRYIREGTYEGFEHDLGAESSTFTGRPALSDGGWSPAAADLLAYTSTLLERHDPAFEEILGSGGVGQLLRFSYPATAPHLIRPTLGPDYQQAAIDAMPGLMPLASNPAGSVYGLADATPLVSLRTNLAIVLGGASGVAALADMPGIDLRDWAVVSASDAVADGGLPELQRLIASADAVMVANESVGDIAVSLASPVVTLPGITSVVPLDRLTQLIPSDASIRDGAMTDAAAPAPSNVDHTSSTFSLDATRTLDVWARIRYAPDASRLTFRVDGRQTASLLPLAMTDAGFRWVRVGSATLAPGEHRVDVEAHRSTFGGAFEVDETRLIDPGQVASVQAALVSSLQAQRDRIAYAFDLPEAAKWGGSPTADTSRPVVDGSGFWASLGDDVSIAPAPGGPAGAVSVTADAVRRFYTVLRADLPDPTDLSRAPYLYLPFEGTGSGLRYDFVVEFRGGGAAHFLFTDDSSEWKDLPFSVSLPDRGEPPLDWRHVVGFRLAIDVPGEGGRFSTGIPRMSTPTQMDVMLPVLASPDARSASIDAVGRPGAETSTLSVPPGADGISLQIPFSEVSAPARILLAPTRELQGSAPATVTFHRDSPTSIRYSVDAPDGGMLVLAQAVDAGWEAHEAGTTVSSTAIMSLDNGFLLPPGRHSGTISYTGQRPANAGLGVSAVALLGLGAGALVSGRRRRGRRAGEGANHARALRIGGVLGLGIAAAILGLRALPGIDEMARAEVPPQPLAVSSDFWHPIERDKVQVREVDAGAGALQISFAGRRSFYTLVQHRFRDPEDWVGRRWLFVQLHGTGDGSTYRFVIDFDTDTGGSATFAVRDVDPGWRVVSLDLWHADELDGTVDWGRVSAIRVARETRRGSGIISIGDVSLTVPRTG